MNTLQMNSILPIRFACDSIPDCQGQIVERIGSFVIIQGMATDSGYWFVKGVGGARRFGNRQEAVDYIEYAQPTLAKDADPYEMDRRFDVKVEYISNSGEGRIISERAFKARSESDAKAQAERYNARSAKPGTLKIVAVKNTGPASMMGSNFNWS